MKVVLCSQLSAAFCCSVGTGYLCAPALTSMLTCARAGSEVGAPARGFQKLVGAGGRTMALIASDCDAICSMSIKWP